LLLIIYSEIFNYKNSNSVLLKSRDQTNYELSTRQSRHLVTHTNTLYMLV